MTTEEQAAEIDRLKVHIAALVKSGQWMRTCVDWEQRGRAPADAWDAAVLAATKESK